MMTSTRRLLSTVAVIAVLSAVPLRPAFALQCWLTPEAIAFMTALSETQTKAIVGAIKEGTSAKSNSDTQQKTLDLGNESISDAKDAITQAQKKTIDDAVALQDTAIEEMKKAPSERDCIDLTSKKIVAEVMPAFVTRTDKMVKAFNELDKKGPQTKNAAAYNKDRMDIRAKEIADGKYSPSSVEANQICAKSGGGSKCVNEMLEKSVSDGIAVADRAPWKAKSSATLQVYQRQRIGWEQSRGEALAVVAKTMPKMYKDENFYAMALASYTSAFNGDGAKAKATLAQQYPNSDKVGLSRYELQEAEFFALTAADQTLVSIGQTDAQRERGATLLQAYAAQLQIDRLEKQEFEQAQQVLGVAAPGTPTSGIEAQ